MTKPVTLLLGASYLREQGSYNRALNTASQHDSLYTYTRQDLAFTLSAVR